MKETIVKILKKAIEEEKIKIEKKEIEPALEVPPSVEMGDYAFPCFILTSKMKMPPSEIALKIRANIKEKDFKEIQTSGPYINFFIDRKILAVNLIKQIRKDKDKFGSLNLGKGKKVVIEFPSPNTNKPLHLGHLRNISIGESVSRILEFSGEKVIRTNLNNDKGVHICKSMLAYKKWGKNKKPSKKNKSDHLVGDFYVMYSKKSKNNPKLESEAHEMLRKWEDGNSEIISLWKKMRDWSLKGFSETYKKLGIKHDQEYFESDIYKEGKEIILEGVNKKLFEQEKDGAVSINLEKQGLGKKYLLRADGTTIYMTQDIYLAFLKQKQFNPDELIYVVANEQDYHFKVLFYILNQLGFEKEKLKHLSYGMVNLPEGKMKSREGNVVDIDELIEEVKKLVGKEIKKREPKISKKELENRSNIISLAAIKYFLLKIDAKKNMLFNPKESIKFEGNTGPYLLYSYARANSILRKAKKKNKILCFDDLEKKELELIKKLSDFSEIIANAFNQLNPSLIANYSYELSQIFNEFYHTCPVIDSEKQEFRISLVESFKQVLKNSLSLLGIETLEKM